MIVFKKILVIKEVQESNTYAILKFENIKDKTNINVRVVSSIKGKFSLIFKINNIQYNFNVNKIDDIKLDNKIDLNEEIRAILIYNDEIVSSGSTKGYFNYIEMYEQFKNDCNIKELKKENINNEIKDLEQDNVELKCEDIKIEEQEEIFFDKIKNKISELFKSYKEDLELMALIPNSKWVRVEISSDSYYVVGIIYSNEIPALICYGVPDKDDKNPPNNDKKCMQWFKIDDNLGYWMMYQNAKDGKTLTNEEIIM